MPKNPQDALAGAFRYFTPPLDEEHPSWWRRFFGLQ
jgi:hypothetical protein